LSQETSGAASGRSPRQFGSTNDQIFADSPTFLANHTERTDLYPAEETIVGRIRAFLDGKRMLDIGIGRGRTSAHFAPLVGEYVGTDISAAMIDQCVARFGGELGNATFAVADARDLSAYETDSFDFVYFSFNGIDCIDDEADRLQALSELKRVCRPGGYVCFSAHNLAAIDELYDRPLHFLTIHPLPLARRLFHFLGLRVLNPSRRSFAQKPSVILRDGTFNFRLRLYYVRPSEQIAQLEKLGLSQVEVLDVPGEFVPREKADEISDLTVYYLASER
jgi:ubiquinone/menaquinone biosynthesis C-methylase UbiE